MKLIIILPAEKDPDESTFTAPDHASAGHGMQPGTLRHDAIAGKNLIPEQYRNITGKTRGAAKKRIFLFFFTSFTGSAGGRRTSVIKNVPELQKTG